ncbi:hypothetical protein GCM10007385_15540 [Tateyamaria omphalii]|uniref:hypothetical protein n=1 Tax=Tateyamaria omphalii TaxID=299262 RepID=UPI001677E423|nr:hypothetical protein [Tateyamaria omphalii]GGX48484.1 hypothetical protein GCM10007385_15540 [Tateyamaria omphalii]
MRVFFLSAFVLLGVATSAVAEQYVCEIKAARNSFVSPVLAFDFVPGQKSALVYDVFIHEVHGEPVSAKVKKMGDQKYRLQWVVSGIPTTSTPARVSYRATMNVATQQAIVRGNIFAADNTVQGRGTCVKEKFTE